MPVSFVVTHLIVNVNTFNMAIISNKIVFVNIFYTFDANFTIKKMAFKKTRIAFNFYVFKKQAHFNYACFI